MSKRTTIPWTRACALVALGLGGPLAQDGRPFPSQASAPVKPGPEQRLEALTDEYDAARRAARQAIRAATTPAEVAAARRANPWEAFAARFESLAQEAEGTPVAAKAWGTILDGELSYGKRDKAMLAFQMLAHDHASSPELVRVLPRLIYVSLPEDELVAGLRNVVETSEHRPARANAMFVLAKRIEGRSGAEAAEALAIYRTIRADYAEVSDGRGSTLAGQAEACIYELEHLQVGMTAPDFASVDETGTKFKLSEYRGKVVLLDFWGFW